MLTTLAERTLAAALEIQQIPAPTFAEQARADDLARRFRQAGLRDIHSDEIGNVFARLPGGGLAQPLVVSAHLDTVFSAETPLTARQTAERITGPGIGDNATGLAALLGLVWALEATSRPLPGDLWLVANVGEEGLGNLRGMQAVVDRFDRQVRGYIILEGLAFGQVYHRALASERYRIQVQTAGGHSWVDYGRASAVHELARLVTALVGLPLPSEPRTTLNVGKLSGGTSINTIAADAQLELDLRSEDPRQLAGLVGRVEQLCRDREAEDVRVSVEMVGRRPGGSLPAEHPLVALAARSLKEQGVQPRLNIGSTDANVPLSRGLPAVCVGITTGGGAHTQGEYINTRPVARGLEQLLALVLGAYSLP
jgi:acetylornithine deacetylase/succinyl-diaminopimelate desuccinylase-like protein